MSYNDAFYLNQYQGSRDSACEVVPIVLEYLKPLSVVDLGCGRGTWLSVFMEHGIDDVMGFDGAWVNKSKLCIPPEKFVSCNLCDGVKTDRIFDLAVSLEVAEHLPFKFADNFVDDLTKLAPVILFSAAIIRQGGVNHLNEQMLDFWVGLFAKRGYVPVDPIRRRIWSNHRVEPWYAQNILFFVKQNQLRENPRLMQAYENTFATQLSIVHPSIYLYKTNPKNLQLTQVLRALPSIIRRTVHDLVLHH